MKRSQLILGAAAAGVVASSGIALASPAVPYPEPGRLGARARAGFPLEEGETKIYVISLTTTKGMADFWSLRPDIDFLDRPMSEQLRHGYHPVPDPNMLFRDWLQTAELMYLGEVQKRWVNGRLVCRLNSLQRLDRQYPGPNGREGWDSIWAADYSRFESHPSMIMGHQG